MKHFLVEELVDKETYQKMGNDALMLFNPAALRALDNLREFFGCPVTVNNWHVGGPFEWRGYRTKEKAAALGSPNSEHAKGNAFDCDIAGYTAEEARQKILANKNNALLVEIMRMEGGVNWLHFDLKPVPERIRVFKA